MKSFLLTYFIRILDVVSWMLIFLIYSFIAGLDIYSEIVYPLYISTLALSFISATNTMVIEEIKKRDVSHLIIYYFIFFVVSIFLLSFSLIEKINLIVFIYFFLTGIRNIEYAIYRAKGHTRDLSVNSLITNIIGITLLFFSKNFIHFFLILSIVRFLEIIFMQARLPKYLNIKRLSGNISINFFKINLMSYLFLLVPLFLTPLDKGIMINILEPELLGFYQLNDQINTGFYVLIMSILYVKLPDLFSLLKNKTQLKYYSRKLHYLFIFPIIFILLDLVFWSIYPSGIKFDIKLYLIVISSFYKSSLAYITLIAAIFLTKKKNYKLFLSNLLIILFLLASVSYFEFFNVISFSIVGVTILYVFYNNLKSLVKSI